MPNIVIVEEGKQSRFIHKNIAKIVTELGVSANEGVITYAEHGLSCVDMNGFSVPYLIVRDTNEDRGMKIAKALNKKLHVDVEVEKLFAFLPR